MLILPNFRVEDQVKKVLFLNNKNLEKIISLETVERVELKSVTLRKTFMENVNL